MWPEADFIVGNPPFIAGKDLRAGLGDGYALALGRLYQVNRSADLALVFLVEGGAGGGGGKARRFGSSLELAASGVSAAACRRGAGGAGAGASGFAVPDHPWTDGSGGAAVRIAMTVAAAGQGDGVLAVVTAESAGKDGVPEVSLESPDGTHPRRSDDRGRT